MYLRGKLMIFDTHIRKLFASSKNYVCLVYELSSEKSVILSTFLLKLSQLTKIVAKPH